MKTTQKHWLNSRQIVLKSFENMSVK